MLFYQNFCFFIVPNGSSQPSILHCLRYAFLSLPAEVVEFFFCSNEFYCAVMPIKWFYKKI
jgi:hypothetical protein